MAALGKFIDASVTINSVDLTSFVRSVTLNTSRSEEDLGAMGDSWINFSIGRGEWSVDIEFWQSFYTAEVDATLWPLINNPGSGFTIEILPTSSGVSATNPKYTGTVLPMSYDPISGSFDENLSTTMSFRGTGTLSRAVA